MSNELNIVKTTCKSIKKSNTTNDLVSYERSIKIGEKIQKSNRFFKDFTLLMNSPEFTNFYENYFSNWSDIETMIFYMKLYKAVEYGYKKYHDDTINENYMIFILHKIISTNELRQNAIQIFNNFKESTINDYEFFDKLVDFKSIYDNKSIES